MTLRVSKESPHSLLVNNARLEFREEIGEILTAGNRVIALLEPSDFADEDPESGRNVFAYDANGELLWRIEDAGFTALGKDGQKVPQGYTDIWMEEGELKADQPIGCECTIDIETGKIIGEELGR